MKTAERLVKEFGAIVLPEDCIRMGGTKETDKAVTRLNSEYDKYLYYFEDLSAVVFNSAIGTYSIESVL